MLHDRHRLDAMAAIVLDQVAREPAIGFPILRPPGLQVRPPYPEPLPADAGVDGVMRIVDGLDDAEEGVNLRYGRQWLRIPRSLAGDLSGRKDAKRRKHEDHPEQKGVK